MGPKVSKPHLFIGASTTETSFVLRGILPVCQGGWKIAFSWNSCVGSATTRRIAGGRQARREGTPPPNDLQRITSAAGGPVPHRVNFFTLLQDSRFFESPHTALLSALVLPRTHTATRFGSAGALESRLSGHRWRLSDSCLLLPIVCG